MSETRKNLSSFFHQIKFIVFKKLWLKKLYSAIVPHLFLGFFYSLIPVGFRATLMSFVEFLESKNIPRRIFNTRE